MSSQDGFLDAMVFDDAGDVGETASAGFAGGAGVGVAGDGAGVGGVGGAGSVNDPATASASGAPANVSFKEGIGELEEIIRELEGGQLELEDSLLKYERGVGLLRALQSKISDAEQKVTVLLGEIEPESSDAIDEQLS